MNPVDIIILVGAVAVVAGVVFFALRKRRKGGSPSCGCDCGGCGASEHCASKKTAS